MVYLNIHDDVPSQNVMVTFVWCILDVLNIHQFGMVLVLHPRPCNVLAIYQVSALPLAPSEKYSAAACEKELDNEANVLIVP